MRDAYQTLINCLKFSFVPPIGQDMHKAPSAKPPKSGPESHYVRWKFDPNATDSYVEPRELVNLDGEMPKVDSRYETKPYSFLFLAITDPEATEAPVGGTYNAVAKCNVNDGIFGYWSAGPGVALHEVAFVPRSFKGKYISKLYSYQCRW